MASITTTGLQLVVITGLMREQDTKVMALKQSSACPFENLNLFFFSLVMSSAELKCKAHTSSADNLENRLCGCLKPY